MNRKDLNPESSLQAAYGARLRDAREERGWTQEELGERLGYASTHVSAVETGRKYPTQRFSRRVDQVLGTGDFYQRKSREIRQGSMLEGFPDYLGYEARAVEIRLFQVGLIPGLLQTPEYARMLADSAVQRGSITSEQADERVSILLERQEALERNRPPMMMVVMDESCVRRPVGGSDVMRGQFEQLLDFAALSNTVLQVAPFEMGERRTFDLPVNLLTLPDRSLAAYAEAQTQGHLDRETRFVAPLLTAYHQLQAEALSQAETVAMIQQVMKG